MQDKTDNTGQGYRLNRNTRRLPVEARQLIAEGQSNLEMAERLFTSRHTVERHRQNLIAKTHSRNTAEVIKHALREGLIG